MPPIEPLAAPAADDLPQPGTATRITLVREAAWIPPDTQPPLGEQPAHRRSTIGLIRSRAFLLFSIAASAGIPLVLGITGTPGGLPTGLGAGAPPAYARPAPDIPSATAHPAPGAPSLAPGRGPDLEPGAPGLGSGPSMPPSALPSADEPLPTAIASHVAPGRPAPITTPSMGGIITLEAEGNLAERGGSAVTRALADASGGVVVTGLGNGPENVVRFASVTVRQAGRYTITFHYVSAEQSRARVIVNGSMNMVQLPATGDKWGVLGAVSVQIPLSAGTNTIEFGNKNAPAPDLDRLVITRQTLSPQSPNRHR
ncbi:MAG TPA: hypothetical protein VFX60_13895 [Micromonospora sp.]|nr:hypothetical protein [Micromonospora sp.]